MIIHYKNVRAVSWPSQYFTPAEIACRSDGLVLLDDDSIDALRRLDALREAVGHPLILNSAYRSAAHNAAVGGAKNSYHMRGVAFDVRMDNVDPARFEMLAKQAGFRGFGFYPKQGFMHIDTRPVAASWGDRFPARESRFASEPARQTAARDLVDAMPAPLAAAAPLEIALREIAPHVADDWQGYIIVAAAFIGLAVAVWRIMARARQPRGAA